jgi:hypothetical protein
MMRWHIPFRSLFLALAAIMFFLLTVHLVGNNPFRLVLVLGGSCLLFYMLLWLIYGIWCFTLMHRYIDWRLPLGKRKQLVKVTMTDAAKQKYAPQMAAIGEWTDKSDRYCLNLLWSAPKALAGNSIPFDLVFNIESESGDFDADDKLFALWECYRLRHPGHVPGFQKRIVTLYGETDFPPPWDQYADLRETEVLRMVRGRIEISRREYKEDLDYSLRAGFFFRWDEEHGYHFLPYDEANDRFGDEWE